jgi:hypothetical protein
LKITELPPSPEFHQASIKAFRELLARTWLQRYITDPRSGEKVSLAETRKFFRWFPEGRFLEEEGLIKGEGPLIELERLLGPIVALQFAGSPKELRRKKEELIAASRETLSVPFLKVEIVDSNQQHINELIENLEELASRAEEAERTLIEAGWKFDYATGKVKVLPTPGLPNRPKEFFNECVEALYDLIRDDSAPSKARNTEELRQRIHGFLEGFFPEEMITTDRKGPIWRAINNHLHK